MTTGSYTSGSSVPVSTNTGPGFIKSGYTRKSWTGTDYPKTIRSEKPTRFTTRTLVTRRGGQLVEYEQPIRLYVPNHPPKRALVVEHPYSMSLSVQNDSVLYYKLDATGPTYSGTGLNTGFAARSVRQGWDSNDDIALLGKLREQVAGSSFNAGVFLGEGKEALSMITNAAIRLAGAIRNAKRGNMSKAWSILTRGTDRFAPPSQVAASNWLELQYGWLPLLHDMEDGAKFLAHHHSYPLQHVVYARLIKPGLIQSASPSNTRLLGCKAYTSVQIKAILKEKSVVNLSGLTDVASIAWELTPYSFLIDWAIPIGEYLQARGLAQSLSGTFVTSKKTYFSWSGAANVGANVQTWGTHSEMGVTLDRTVSSSLRVPLPEVVPLKEMFSWKRAANALALLVTANR